VKESPPTAVRFPKVADFRDLNLGLAMSLHGTLNGVASIQTDERWGKISPAQATGSRPNDRYIKPESILLG